ncbi:TRAP transporter substrate-binding protein [Hominifimenecus sp. rT4P-3]|uniref:TRAP transporter substrate-binding protein n=1 Tax=Hominifimenecus sp. rT4P-3 TaxID=3242979 RepID=UPI003DA315B5
MKKIIAMMTAIALGVSLLAGCGNGNTTETKAPSAAETGTAAQSGTEAAAGTEAQADGDVIVMKLANPNPAGDIRDQVCLKFSELVSEKTGGKVRIDVYSGGSLGDWRDCIEGLSMGIDEIVIEAICSLNPYTELANFEAIPYVYRDADHFMKVMMGDLGKEICEEVGEAGGFKMVGPQYRGAKVTTSQKPFHNIDEVKGLKMRVPSNQVNIDTWAAFGASPTPLALSETFTALQQHTVEGQDNSIIESYGHGFYDVCDYLMMTNHNYNADVWIFDREYFNNLDPEIQTAIEEAAQEAAEWRTQAVLEEEKEYLKKWEEAGVEIIYPELDGFREAVADFAKDKYPALQDLVSRVQAVQ